MGDRAGERDDELKNIHDYKKIGIVVIQKVITRYSSTLVVFVLFCASID